MLRTSIIAAVCALAVPLLLAGTSGASTTVGSLPIKGMVVSMSSGPSGVVKHGSPVHFTINTGTWKASGLSQMHARAFLPGVSISKMSLPSSGLADSVTTKIYRTIGGVGWYASRLPGSLGVGAEIYGKVTGKPGSQSCDKVVVTLAGGKSGTWKFPCYKVAG